VALAQDAEITLLGLRENSLQGDMRILSIMENLGVRSHFNGNRRELSKKDYLPDLNIDFADCPDLAQTVAVVCAVKGITCKMTGLESLRIKETDRILALQNELAKIDARLLENNGLWTLIPRKVKLDSSSLVEINTYDDHRMAMAFAPLTTHLNLRIEHPDVVNKSYPGYWNDLSKTGIVIKNE
jgi:3-phosphoshikimate 1-carboxyvinyltransferase